MLSFCSDFLSLSLDISADGKNNHLMDYGLFDKQVLNVVLCGPSERMAELYQIITEIVSRRGFEREVCVCVCVCFLLLLERCHKHEESCKSKNRSRHSATPPMFRPVLLER